MSKKSIIVGTRGSKLALRQTNMAVERLKRAHPGLQSAIRIITTSGDRDRHTDLAVLGGQGVFTKELEESLLRNDVDLAVHSLKDMPSEVSPGLKLAAIAGRDDPRDALISRTGEKLASLPAGALVGTGSQRRALQLRVLRPDLKTAPLRGNVDTRLHKLAAGEYDAIILAAAALLRMGWGNKITEYLPADVFLPAVGQGALALEVRESDAEMVELVSAVNDVEAERAVTAERAFLAALGGGCRAPIAAHATISDGALALTAMVGGTTGSRTLSGRESGKPEDAVQIGRRLAERLLQMGAGEFIGGNGK